MEKRETRDVNRQHEAAFRQLMNHRQDVEVDFEALRNAIALTIRT